MDMEGALNENFVTMEFAFARGSMTLNYKIKRKKTDVYPL